MKLDEFPSNDKYNPIMLIKKYFTIKTHTIGDSYVQTTQCKMIKHLPKNPQKNQEKQIYISILRFGLFELLNDKKLCKKLNLDPKSIEIINKIQKGNKPNTPFKWTGKFQANQALVANYIMTHHYSRDSVNQGKSGVIVKLNAGQGKTFLAMGLINKIQRKTLVVVHSETVLYDWTKELSKLFPETSIGWFYGKKKIDGDIQIAIIDSLLGDEFTFRRYLDQIPEKNTKRRSYELITLQYKEFFAQFGFIIFDEAHEYCSKCRSNVFWRAQARFMLGLSATPNERLDKFDPVAWWGIGPILDAKTLSGYSEAQIPFTGRVHMIKYIGPPEYIRPIMCEKTQIISTPLMLNNMVKDPYRLEVICDEIKKLYDANQFTFVFADRCDYLATLRARLLAKNIKCEYADGLKVEMDNTPDDKDKIVKLTGGASAQEMKYAEDQARIILTTYQYMQTGKSIPKMTSIVLATSRKSKMIQTCGRIFRMCSDYSIERQIVDIVDWGTIFKNQWYKRKKFYDEKNYPIEVKKIEYTQVFACGCIQNKTNSI